MNNKKYRVYREVLYCYPLKVLYFFSILCVGFMGVSSCTSSKQDALGTYDDPEIALKETQKVITMLSQNINLGYKSVQYVDEYEIAKNKLFNLD